MTGRGRPSGRFKNERVVFWLQLEPGQPLVGEGIGQHLSHMLAAWKDADTGVATLVAPAWSRGAVEDIFSTYDLPRHLIRARYFGVPFLSTILAKRAKKKTREIEARDFALARSFEGMPGSELLALLLLPFVPLALIAYFFARLLGSHGRGLTHAISNSVQMLVRGVTFGAMASYVNSSRAFDYCIVPIGTWTLCRLIRSKPLVVQIPDVVFLEFPEQFDRNPDVNRLAAEIEKVAKRADAVISPSAYVRKRHIVDFLGVEASRAYVVPHAPMLLGHALARVCGGETLPGREVARSVLARHWPALIEKPGYLQRLGGSLQWLSQLRNIDLQNRRLVYFPTQYRQYKNIERAIDAIHELRDESGPPISILLTADLSVAPGLIEHILDSGLGEYVLPLPRVPQPLHALAYAASDLALAASRFEGGFPFIFCEALSVGVGVVMAETPVVRDTIAPNLRPRTLFKPDDASDMARVIRRALADDGLFLEQSRSFYAMSTQRRWSNVLEDYLRAGRTAKATFDTRATQSAPRVPNDEFH